MSEKYLNLLSKLARNTCCKQLYQVVSDFDHWYFKYKNQQPQDNRLLQDNFSIENLGSLI